jgi:hypothetical protein
MKWIQLVSTAAPALAAALTLPLCAAQAVAQVSPTLANAVSDGRSADTWLRDGDVLFFQYAPKTLHFRPSPNHVKWTNMVAAEIHSKYDRVWGADQTIMGLALFDNSFGQFSQYIYWGQKWDLHPNFYAKVTAGLLHGYSGKYRDKIPFNKLGVAPAIVPSVGLRFGNASIEGILLGGSAFMFAAGYTFK